MEGREKDGWKERKGEGTGRRGKGWSHSNKTERGIIIHIWHQSSKNSWLSFRILVTSNLMS